MKILQICYVYPPYFSGYGKQLNTINIELVKKYPDVEIEILTAYGKKISNYNNSISVFSLFSNAKNSKLKYYVFSIFCGFLYLRKFFTADVIHIVKAGPELIFPVLISKILSKKVIVKVAQDDLEALLGTNVGFLKRVRKYFLKKSDAVIAISDKIRSEGSSIGIDNSKLLKIPNGVDANRFIFQDRDIKDCLEKKFIFVGSISKRKGVVDLLNALNLIENGSFIFSFVGPLDDVENFEDSLSEINKKGVVNAVYFGQVENPELILREHDCLVLPSYSEGMPNVVLEALSSGLHVLLSDIEIHKEMSSCYSADIFARGNCNDLADKIIAVNRMEYSLRQRIQQHEKVKKVMGLEIVAGQYYSLYKSLLLQRSSNEI